MRTLSIFLLFVVTIGSAQVPHNNCNVSATAGSDSLVDVFPLSVGNQWTYGYLWMYGSGGPIGTGSYTDTGSVTIHIIDKIVTSDSTIWLIQQNFHLWVQYDTGAFNGPTNTIDTIEIVELHQGHHRLYNAGDVSTLKYRQSVFPFPPIADTIIYRYDTVNALGMRTFRSNGENAYIYSFSFKQSVGLYSISIDDGCTCMSGFYGMHTLRSQILTDVATYEKVRPSMNYHLSQNYPNPFNPSTMISFSVPLRSFVSLKVFDCIGREVETLFNDELNAGNYTRQWNASYLPSGVYYYRLQSGSFMETRKLLLLK